MIVELFVIPSSKKFSLFLKDGRLKATLRSPPEKNKANIELVKELSSLLGRPVRIIAGQTSRRKKLEIAISEGEFAAFLKLTPK